jgi:hypothetical protein
MTCRDCRRPRATRADVTRWDDEFGDSPADSAWAAGICWQEGKARCYRKPLDRHRRVDTTTRRAG